MGMTINNHIEILKSYYNGFTGQAGNLQDSIDVAVCIMRKYEKIEQIYDNWNVDFGVETHRAMSQIGEVLNGNNNQNRK